VQSGAADPGRFVLAGPRVGKSPSITRGGPPQEATCSPGQGSSGAAVIKNARVRTEMVNADVKKKTLRRTQQRRRVDINDYKVLPSVSSGSSGADSFKVTPVGPGSFPDQHHKVVRLLWKTI